jgi:hypothetical protein
MICRTRFLIAAPIWKQSPAQYVLFVGIILLRTALSGEEDVHHNALKRTFAGAAILIALMGAGCSQAPTPTQAPAGATAAPQATAFMSATPAPTITVDPGGDADAPATYQFSGLQLDKLDNYSAKLTLAFQGTNTSGAPASLTTTSFLNGRRNPFSQMLEMQYDAGGVNTAEIGLGEAASGQFRILITPETAYITQNINTDNEACVSVQSQEASTLVTSLTSFDDLLGTSVPVMNRVDPNEVIANLESRHYHLDTLTNTQFTSGTLDVWVDRASGVVTKLVINGNGTFPNLGTGLMNTQYELLSTLQSVDYSPPDCAPLNQP